MRSKNNLVKKLGITFLICGVLASCKQSKEDDNTNLLLANLLFASTGAKAVVYMEQVDPFTFTGYCLDNFSPTTGVMTADTYYNLHPMSSLLGPLQRSALVGKNKTTNKFQSCSDLGFSGATAQKGEDGVVFDMYSCGPQATACNSKASKEAGFK